MVHKALVEPYGSEPQYRCAFEGRPNSPFVETAVFKRDVFSETRAGYFANDPDTRIIRRVVSAAPWWSSPLAWILARREIRGLKTVRGIEGVPQLIATDRDGLYRSWTEGTPLHLARPSDPKWYRTAHRVLRDMRRLGVTHNDLAKPQNWLMTPEGEAAVIDFQLASVHRRRGALYRLMAYEDFRHLIKQKRAFAKDLMTPTEKRILARRSLPSRIWLATGKKVYNFITAAFLAGRMAKVRATVSTMKVRQFWPPSSPTHASRTWRWRFIRCQPRASVSMLSWKRWMQTRKVCGGA